MLASIYKTLNMPLVLISQVTTKNEIEVPNLDPSDKRVLIFFAAQAANHATNLTVAIDAFLLTIEQNQPPAAFLAHGKFVVLSAHKLVSIGDSVHRHVGCAVVRAKVLQASNALSDALASAVNKTKKAALHFPSVAAVQEMVDGVVDISHLAKELKVQIGQAATFN
jgi:Crk-Associated Substrate C-terminal domain